jgi:hypothetical protein
MLASFEDNPDTDEVIRNWDDRRQSYVQITVGDFRKLVAASSQKGGSIAEAAPQGRYEFAAHGVRGDGSVQWTVRTSIVSGNMEPLGRLKKARTTDGRPEWHLYPHGGNGWRGPFKTRKAALESGL